MSGMDKDSLEKLIERLRRLSTEQIEDDLRYTQEADAAMAEAAETLADLYDEKVRAEKGRDEALVLSSRQRAHISDMGRRIHNQRVALRNNWQAVEERADFLKRLPHKSSMLDGWLRTACRARDAEAKAMKTSQALEQIAGLDTIEAALDPEWAIARARAAIVET